MEPSRHYNLIIIGVIKLYFFERINKLVGVHCDELHYSSFPVLKSLFCWFWGTMGVCEPWESYKNCLPSWCHMGWCVTATASQETRLPRPAPHRAPHRCMGALQHDEVRPSNVSFTIANRRIYMEMVFGNKFITLLYHTNAMQRHINTS